MTYATSLPTADETKNMSEPKYCEDCRFCEGSGEFAHCVAPQNIESDKRVDLISPTLRKQVQYRYVMCSTQRTPPVCKSCGPDALWFEPREGSAT